MKITSQSMQHHIPQQQTQKSKDEKKATSEKPATVDAYIPSKEEKVVTYKKPTTKVDAQTIEQLKAESEKAHAQLRDLVRRMLERQGVTMEDIRSGQVAFKVDEEARVEAQAAIADDGPLSAENVSDQIVKFAKAISGGDTSKFDLLKNAIDEGFKAAKQALGGSLPEISQKTYDLVMEKLDKWKNEEK